MIGFPLSAREMTPGASPSVQNSGSSSARVSRTPKIKRTSLILKNRSSLMSEEVGIMKREKHNLIQEKSLLKAKITRLLDLTKHPNRYSAKTTTDQNSLEREYRKVEQLGAAKRSEIAQLESSDTAAIVKELQEECLMLHMELIRIRSEKQRIDIELRHATKDLQEANAQFNPDLVKRQDRIINELKRQISDQNIRNEKIRAKLYEKENEKEENKQNEAQIIFEKTVSDLEAQIKAEQDSIAQLESEMKTMDEENIAEISKLQESLSRI